MSKQDRQGVRKASDIEQKYNLTEPDKAMRLIAEARATADRAQAAAVEVNKVYQQFTGQSSFMENVTVDYAKNYTVVRVFRDRYDGKKQFPFVYVPYGLSNLSSMDVARRDGWYLVINGGMVSAGAAMGVVVENGLVVQEGVNGERRPLVIDGNGELSCVAFDTTAESIVNSGYMSAVCGYGAIIEDYAATLEVESFTEEPRQIIGQFGNGDYAIITCVGAWTIADTQGICVELGLRFAYALGGAADTALGMKTLCSANTEEDVANYIVFNGTDNYAKPG